MLNLNDHLISGELSGGDGRIANLFEFNSNYSINCQRDDSNFDAYQVLVFDKRSPINLPVAAAYFYSDQVDVAIDVGMYIHESLEFGYIESQLFLLNTDLAFRVRNDLLEIPEGHNEDLPEALTVMAGDSEEEADLVIEWLSELLSLTDDVTGFEKRQRNSVSYIEGDLQLDDTDEGWDVILNRKVINRIASLSETYIPQSIKEGLYGQLSA